MLDWIEALRGAITYIEAHLMEECTAEEISRQVNMSPFYFQKGFKMITGYTIGEYVRNRRLYLAALDVIKREDKIIDLAYKYGYDTPESFTKAFRRFHGLAPMQLKNVPHKLSVFLPLQISLSIKGGDQIDYRIEKMAAFKVIGLGRKFHYESAFAQIPGFWEECLQKHMRRWCQEVPGCNMGTYGICLEPSNNEPAFRYLVAGLYDGGKIPEDLEVAEIPALTWAKFRCIGPIPETLQQMNTRIYSEWLPGNTQYEIAAGYNIEMYSKADLRSLDYVSEIWIPVKEK